MNTLTIDEINEIRDAAAELKRASKKVNETNHRILVPGTLLCWRSRGYLQEGEVIRVIAFGEDVRVRNHRTMKEFNLNLYWVDWAKTALLSTR